MTASDNCDANVFVFYNGQVRQNGNCADNYTLTRTWTANDNCGNTEMCTQVITVQDTQSPIFDNCPADVTVECDAIPTVPNLTAMDNCDAIVQVVYNGQVRQDGNCADNYTLTRTWTATDNCGNTEICTQVITVLDTQSPMFTDCPADVTVECDAVPAPATPSATDNCDADVTVVYNGQVRQDGNCADNYTLTRTWTATDNCGNTEICTQVVTVQDTQSPMFTDCPVDVTVECDACLLYTSDAADDSVLV